LALFMVAFCVALLPIDAYAAQSSSPQSAAPPEHATAEKLAELQRDVSQLESELELRQEVSRLRKEVEDRSKPTWVLAVPWFALGIVGLGFVVAWLVLNWRERVLNWHKEPDPEALKTLEERLAKLNEQVSELSKSIGEIGESVTTVIANINELWRTLAISRLTSSIPNPDR
jgi:peptidoglycan hydrolase CwlO-like protein